jgi:hypothetical protein
MTLWALRGAVIGRGAWLLIRSEKNLNRLRNSSRSRLQTSSLIQSAEIQRSLF